MSKNDEGGLLREVIMSLVMPLVKLSRTYEYTVKRIEDTGRMDLVPTRSKIAPKLAGVPQWGPSGTRARPRVGSTVAVTFLDGDPGRPVICAFAPLSTEVGRPVRIDIDADEIRLGEDATRGVARISDTVLCTLPPAVFNGTMNGSTPISGAVVFSGSAMGTIQTASTKASSE